MFFLQRTYCRDRKDTVHTKLLESVHIRAKVQLGRQNAVPAAVSRKECDLAAFQVPDHVGVGRLAERRMQSLLVRVRQPGHGVQTAAPNDPYLRLLLHAGSAWKTESVIIQNRV